MNPEEFYNIDANKWLKEIAIDNKLEVTYVNIEEKSKSSKSFRLLFWTIFIAAIKYAILSQINTNIWCNYPQYRLRFVMVSPILRPTLREKPPSMLSSTSSFCPSDLDDFHGIFPSDEIGLLRSHH